MIKKDESKDDKNTPQNKPVKSRRQQKIRMAQTAPANIHFQNPNVVQASTSRKEVKSGPETKEEKEQMLKIDRRKSMYIQLSGKGKDPVSKEETKPPLPRPNPKTLLDVMMGLNAFSHVPQPGTRQGGTGELYEDIRAESRESTLGRSSIYDSTENIAQKFIFQWRKNIASRKDSICMKLESFDNQMAENALQRSMSVAFSTVPEDYESDDNFVRRKQSKMSHRQTKMITPSLPAIHDDDERQEIFMAWVKEEKDKLKDEVPVYQNPAMEKLAKRRNSFVAWLKARNDKMKTRPDSAEKYFNTSGGSGLRNILEEDDDDKPNTGDLMRTILKIKTKFRDPLDSRVKKFNSEIEKMKERDAALRNKPSTKEQRRKWIMLTKGIDAESSDDDDECYW